ncbi:MAG: hypothetical protein NUV80_05280 [Candidatus Berkelbacteria bacterium]|nr:hypothetical protein [Candidatus Berkelbacteria bacterium]MCR4307948.1 hypothetical protein [Candidatus Berkelbacteria bacterium]
MLTKSDLQNIEALFDKKFDEKFDQRFKPLKVELSDLIDHKLEPLKKDIKKIKTDVAQTRKDINMVIGVFDNDNTKLRQRVEIIEDRVGIRH